MNKEYKLIFWGKEVEPGDILIGNNRNGSIVSLFLVLSFKNEDILLLNLANGYQRWDPCRWCREWTKYHLKVKR